MSWLYPIRFQWLEWLLALGFVLFSLLSHFKLIRFKIPKQAESFTLLAYLLIAAVCKFTQYQALQLHAFDFWLFEDLIDHLAHGYGMVTRFAPQEPGAVQHGVIHGFWPLILLSPLVWVFGSFWVTLLFNPLAIVGSGFLLVRLMKQLGLEALDRWIVLVAFLFHFSTTEMLMQDMHPEVIYPLVCFWIWNLYLAKRSNSAIAILCFVVGSFKEDAALLVAPILFLNRAKPSQWVALGLGAIAHWGGMKYAAIFSSVRVPVVSAWGTARLAPLEIIDHLGGLVGILRSWFGFMVHSTTLFFLAVCPWLLVRRQFWILWLPYSLLFALLGVKAKLTNYYAAPFIAIMFVMIVFELSKRDRFHQFKRGVVFLVALLVGSNGLISYIQRAPTPEIRAAVRAFHPQGMGVVAGPFLGLVDMNHVWGDRAPIHSEDWSKINFIILPKGWANYEIPMSELNRLEVMLSRDTSWKREPSSSEYVQFWVKKI